ncbi:cGMP-dependent protein kinase, isozyme 1 [Cryptotermes secundus]|uniref:cGMP-dependent protein kinase n=2 Tax=Cryptotermes secundus TaxID=105785 RepID=A0A2J7RN62_9NEOP|nr:cGMP-dependent protein kinase, isozyme 1 isoform X2 [Cryptotermes secundus]XP_023715301.1 cGMP-dependent protein kinase, isozyme 1 isoform X2 [Cryptotermes secundus]PNF42262.1 cGMP-dependent protein kinase, isozyme 1 [Cryptotermes secundus]
MGDEIKAIQQGTQTCLSKQFGHTVASVPMLVDSAIASNHLTDANLLTGSCDATVTTDQISQIPVCNSCVSYPAADSDGSVLLCKHVVDPIGQSPSFSSCHNIDTNVDQSGYKEDGEMANEYYQHDNIKHQTLPATTKVTGLETSTDATNVIEDQSISETSAEGFFNIASETERKEETIINLRNESIQYGQEDNIKHNILPVTAEEKTAKINTADRNLNEEGQEESQVVTVDFHNNVAKVSVLQDFAEGKTPELNVMSDVYYTTPVTCTAVCESFYPESVREVSALLQQARCSSPPQTSPPHSTPQLAAVAASSSHSCGSLYAQCGANHHEPVSLNEILIEREHLPSYYRYHPNAIDYQFQGPLVEDEEALFREYHKQQQRFLMGNGVSVGPCTATSSNTAVTAGNLQAAENGQTQRASPTGASPVFRISHPEDYGYLKGLVPQLRREAKDWEAKSDSLETEVLELRRKLRMREQEVMRLQREVHKLKSVLQQATSFAQDGDLLASLQDQHGMAGQMHQQLVSASSTNKKQGVSGESSDAGQTAEDIQIVRFDKDFRSKQLIKDAIMDNDFLKNLDSSQVRELVDSMYPLEYEKGSYVIREGEAGSHLYVSAEGEFEVIKEGKVLGKMGPGKAFGELAILYNCTRTASIRVVSDSKVWVLDRRVFQQIMMRTGLQRLEDNVNFLSSVPLLHNLSNDVLAKIADVLEVEFYPAGAHIIRQGANGDTFFIISSGSVKVTQRIPGRREEEEIRILERGDYFGEQALLKEDCRTASIIALPPGVECLTLDRESFIQLIGDLSELHEKDYGDESRGLSRPSSSFSIYSDSEQEYDYIHLEDLDVIATLGVGGFGRVELVQYMYDKTKTFALKCLKKQHIVDTQQQEHVYSEKSIMLSCRSPFICRLYRTFRDSKYVYMLLEACLGGEVWTILRDRGCFDDHTTRFVTACVIEAFDYLHARGIIYRDLKPENLLLDTQGYVKLVDFGFSKRLGFSSKTWTFCGTPEYVAPEIILNKGHDRAVDYWSLGVLMHELLTGTPPFTATDPMKTYNIILKGIDMVDFPRHITRAAQSLVKRLCRDAPTERLGYQRGGIQDIKKHKWFQGFDWDGLRQRTLVGPIVQQIHGPTDTSNFDFYPKDHDIPPDEFSNWDMDF